MKLASFQVGTRVGRFRRVGAIDGTDYLDLPAGYARHLADEGEPAPEELAAATAPPDIIEFLSRGDCGVAAAETVLEAGNEAAVTAPDDLGSATRPTTSTS